MNSKKRGAAAAALAAVFTLVIMALGYVAVRGNTPVSAAPSPTATCWKVSTVSGGDADRVIKVGVSGTPAKVTAVLLSAAKTDPVVLVSLYNGSPAAAKYGGAITEAQVAAHGCYTDLGQRAWFAVAAEMAAAKATTGTAPATGCNTFVVNGKSGVKCGPISGNRTATVYTWSNGKTTWVMHRCGNPVTPAPPPAPTPKPTPPPSPKPSPTPTCPPQQPHGHYPVCKDGPSADPQSQGNVPPYATKDHPSGDNASEVAQPPQQPVDSGNGIPVGSSPRATPTATWSPSINPGPTTLPSPTTAPSAASGAPSSTAAATGTGSDF